MRQWIPISKFIAITALINDDHEFVSQPNSIIDGLCQYWSPIFVGSSSTFNSELAQQTLQSLPEPKWDWSKFRVPDVRSFGRVLNQVQDSTPGFDGGPFSAHDSPSETSAVLMDEMCSKLRSFDDESPLPMFEFNNLVQACIPNKVTYPFENGIACRATETRSISCKCIDNKTIFNCNCPVFEQSCCQCCMRVATRLCSRAFFTNDIIVIDTVSRIYSNLYRSFGNAISAYFDFGNAFLSVITLWIFYVLRWLQAPRGIISLVQACDHHVYMYIKHAGSAEFMCMVQSGVLQGCPLAALLFVLAMEPFF